jgi:hypothetical protein
MPSVITCPSCGRQLRVPDELQGQRVQCPGCATAFTADGGGTLPAAPPPPPPPPAPAEPVPLAPDEPAAAPAVPRRRRPPLDPDDEDFGEESYDDEPRRRRRRRAADWGRVTAPAICLLITGILGLGVDLFNCVAAFTTPPQQIPKDPGMSPETHRLLQQIENGTRGPVAAAMAGFFALVSLTVILGSIAMLTGRLYGLALTGSIAAMVNLGTCCCLLGLPFGIWSMVILFKTEVKEAFR